MGDCSYRVCEPSVVSEVIDGEAIIMDLRSGAYYSADGVGALVWQAVANGASRSEILRWAQLSFSSTDPGPAISSFLDELADRGLIVVDDRTTGQAAPLPPAVIAFKAPALAAHEDMQDLILLDPIHDVDEVGWPTRKVEPGRP